MLQKDQLIAMAHLQCYMKVTIIAMATNGRAADTAVTGGVHKTHFQTRKIMTPSRKSSICVYIYIYKGKFTVNTRVVQS